MEPNVNTSKETPKIEITQNSIRLICGKTLEIETNDFSGGGYVCVNTQYTLRLETNSAENCQFWFSSTQLLDHRMVKCCIE